MSNVKRNMKNLHSPEALVLIPLLSFASKPCLRPRFRVSFDVSGTTESSGTWPSSGTQNELPGEIIPHKSCSLKIHGKRMTQYSISVYIHGVVWLLSNTLSYIIFIITSWQVLFKLPLRSFSNFKTCTNWYIVLWNLVIYYRKLPQAKKKL